MSLSYFRCTNSTRHFRLFVLVTIDVTVVLNLLKLYPLPLQAIPFLSNVSDER